MGGLISAATQRANNVEEVVRGLLDGYSAEVTTPDRKALDAAAPMMPAGAPVYIAQLPKDCSTEQLRVAMELRQLGLEPIPHITARSLRDRAELEDKVAKLSKQAGVTGALVLGGDRDVPAGDYQSSLELIRSGVFEAHGINKVAVGCYPEGHPRIADDVLRRALFDKLEAAEKAGLKIRLITQLCFDAEAIVRFVRQLRDDGVTATLRVGLAGPAKTTTLMKYALICGVGPSMRALRQNTGMARGLLTRSTPAPILNALAEHIARDPELGITGVHFFTFSALSNTIDWVRQQQSAQ